MRLGSRGSRSRLVAAASVLVLAHVAVAQEVPPPFLVVLGIAQDGGYPQAGSKPDHPAWRDPSQRRLVILPWPGPRRAQRRSGAAHSAQATQRFSMSRTACTRCSSPGAKKWSFAWTPEPATHFGSKHTSPRPTKTKRAMESAHARPLSSPVVCSSWRPISAIQAVSRWSPFSISSWHTYSLLCYSCVRAAFGEYDCQCAPNHASISLPHFGHTPLSFPIKSYQYLTDRRRLQRWTLVSARQGGGSYPRAVAPAL